MKKNYNRIKHFSDLLCQGQNEAPLETKRTNHFRFGVVFTVLAFLFNMNMNAQCLTGSNINTVTPLITWQTIGVSAGIPAYHHFPAQAGVTYTFSYCQGGGSYSGDPYLTITDNVPVAQAANDDFCSLGSQIIWTCSNTGMYRIYMSGCCPCSNAPSATLAYRGSSNPTPPPSCTGTPSLNLIMPPSYTTCPSIVNPPFNFANNYSVTGLEVQWQSTTVSPVGPWSAASPSLTYDYLVTGNNALAINQVSVTTWYQAIVTCTNSGQSITINGGSVYIGPTVVDNVPYLESFEGIAFDGRMPNCSWAVSNASTCLSYTSSQNLNRLPRTGNKYASFRNTPAGTNYYYSNGINLVPGITYSASMWYQSDLTGATNWSNLEILLGTTQSPTGLQSIAAVNGAVVAPFYKSLSNVFTVNTAGVYYVAIRATGAGGNAQFLTWDDLEITIPCQGAGNSPTVTLNASSTNVCSGAAVNLNAAGANTYVWNTGSTASAITQSPTSSGVYFVTGTNTLTGCAVTISTNINVKPAPNVGAISYPIVSCSGQPVSLNATGAGSYLWSHGASGALVTVNPTTTTSYTVIGTNALGCSGSAVVTVPVNNLPSVTALASVPQACAGDAVVLTGSGANSYMWTSSSSPVVLQGSSVNAIVTTVGLTTFTVVGTDNNNCSNSANVSLNINACTGLNSILASANGVNIYPNPTKGEFTVEFTNQTPNTVSVLDVTGRVVAQFNNVTDNVQVNIKALAAGVYYVKVVSSNGVDVMKVIKD